MAGPKRKIDVERLRFQLLEGGKTYKDAGRERSVSKERIRQYCTMYEIDVKKERTAQWYARKQGVPELETLDWPLQQKKEGNLGIDNLVKVLNNLAKVRGFGGLSDVFFCTQIERLGLNPKDFRKRAKTTTLPCAVCGKPVTRHAYYIEKAGYKHFFCDRHCFGKWLGKNFGFGSKKKSKIK